MISARAAHSFPVESEKASAKDHEMIRPIAMDSLRSEVKVFSVAGYRGDLLAPSLTGSVAALQLLLECLQVLPLSIRC